MSNTEERVRATEAAERAALIAEYESRTAALLAEVERLRHELAHRTTAMAAEMDRCGCRSSCKQQMVGGCLHAASRSMRLGCNTQASPAQHMLQSKQWCMPRVAAQVESSRHL